MVSNSPVNDVSISPCQKGVVNCSSKYQVYCIKKGANTQLKGNQRMSPLMVAV